MVKQVYEISEQEIQQYQVWRFLPEDDDLAQDEATVVSFEKIPDSVPSEISIHHAIFTARNDTTYHGYVYSEPSAELSLLQPVIIRGGVQVLFWLGMIKPTTEQIQQFYEALELEPSQLFPMKWASQVVFPGLTTTGTLKGFGYYKSLKRRKVATTK